VAIDSIAGHCPACGTDSLIRGFQGRIQCANTLCDERTAVDTLLTDPHLMDHLVRLTADTFTVRHPLIERLNDALFDCEVMLAIVPMIEDGDEEPGTYRVTGEAPDYTLEEVSHADTGPAVP
jgi:hypothetical protein